MKQRRRSFSSHRFTKSRPLRVICTTGFCMSFSEGYTAETPSSAAASEERITVHHAERPAIQNFPRAGFIEQARRLTASQNIAPVGQQPKWGNFNRGNGEGSGFGPVGRYGIAPWAEDWSYLRDKRTRKDFFDPLKFIALNRDGTIWLSLSGRSRARNWYNQFPMLGTNTHSHSGRFTTRNMLGADLHIGKHVRVFGQLINGTAAGWSGYGYNSTFRKRLDVGQLFAEYQQTIGNARTGIIFGRQQFLDAPSYIMYDRETQNVQLTWNGPRAYAVLPHVRFDAYDFVGTNITPHAMFHDNQDWTTRLYGFDTTFDVPAFNIGNQHIRSYLDLFWIGFHLGGKSGTLTHISSSNIPSTITGATTRNNLGFRWYGTAHNLEYALGALWQGGRFTQYASTYSRNVSAYAINTTLGYRYPTGLLHPFAGLQTDLYSGGNETRSKGKVNTYIAPFSPQNPYLDYTGYVGAGNLVSVAPVLIGSPGGSVSLKIKAPLLWRQKHGGSLYSVNSAYNLPKFHGHFVGIAPNGLFTWAISPHLNWVQDFAWFEASRGIRRAGGKSGAFYQSTFSFAF
ncbi:alginate export family protein [Gluconobacter wancherniae]|uniref:alginate export family protein n=1 Tax=Gluconobacter wancherniae TaxID=1307955 RepID=UPI001B8B2D4F|nr:alginate export family protein [Gluconobacter wancherniae]MBS1094221.1 alginate export family protein [Gluconobacter wancherniae]